MWRRAAWAVILIGLTVQCCNGKQLEFSRWNVCDRAKPECQVFTSVVSISRVAEMINECRLMVFARFPECIFCATNRPDIDRFFARFDKGFVNQLWSEEYSRGGQSHDLAGGTLLIWKDHKVGVGNAYFGPGSLETVADSFLLCEDAATGSKQKSFYNGADFEGRGFSDVLTWIIERQSLAALLSALSNDPPPRSTSTLIQGR